MKAKVCLERDKITWVIFFIRGAIQMINIYKEAGERILLTRVMRGYTRERLAELAEISPKFLYEIETGRKGFSALVLHNLCKALKVDCDYILTGKQELLYDKKLVGVLELFAKDKTEKIACILKEIHELL